MSIRKILLRASACIAALFVVACIAGLLFNHLAIAHARSVAGIPGRLYVIAGHRMHLFCTGSGSPALVLETGLGDDALIWAKVQPPLSNVTRVCAYDRAGFGWSDPRATTQDADAVASQLHQLLKVAGIGTPFVLAAHSIGGLYARAYTMHYPQDLSGLVLIDGATPLQDDRIPASLVAIQDEQRRGMDREKLLMRLGWYRLQGLCEDVQPGFEAYRAFIKADSCVPSQVTAVENELDAERRSGEETQHAGPFASLPVLILSRDPQSVPSNWPPEVARANSVVWNTMQEEAKALSPLGRRVIAKGSDHYLHIDRPDVVIEEVTGLIRDIRAGDFQDFDQRTVTR